MAAILQSVSRNITKLIITYGILQAQINLVVYTHAYQFQKSIGNIKIIIGSLVIEIVRYGHFSYLQIYIFSNSVLLNLLLIKLLVYILTASYICSYNKDLPY